jgi:hypothetical protein
MYICIVTLSPELVHPLCFSPFYLSPLLMVISTALKILYSLVYRKYINRIYVLNFLPLPSLSCMWPALSMNYFSKHCFYLYWVYIQHMRENMWPLAFWTWLTSLKMMFPSSIHLPANDKKFILLYGWIKFRCI